MLLYTNSKFYVINTGISNFTLPTLTFTQIYLYDGINYTPIKNSLTLNLNNLSLSIVPFYGSVKSWSMNVPIGKSLIAVTSLGNVFLIPYVVYQVNMSSINVYTFTNNPTSPFNTSIGGISNPFGSGSLLSVILRNFFPNITKVIIGNYQGEADVRLPSYSTIAYYPAMLTPNQGVINGSFYGNIVGSFDLQGNMTISSFSGSISLTQLFSGYWKNVILNNNNYYLNMNLGDFNGQVIFNASNNKNFLLIQFFLSYNNNNYTGNIIIGNKVFNASVKASYFVLSLNQDNSNIFKYIYIYNSTYKNNLDNYIKQQLNNYKAYIYNINGNTSNLVITASQSSSSFLSISNAPFLSAYGLIKVNINSNSISLNLKNSNVQLVGNILRKGILVNYYYYNYIVMINGNGSGEFYGIPPSLIFGIQITEPILSASISDQNEYIIFENAGLLVYNALIIPPINITATVVIVNNNKFSVNLDYVLGTLSISYYYPNVGIIQNYPSTGTIISFTVSKQIGVTIPANSMKTIKINLSIPTANSLSLLYYIYQENSQIPLLVTLFLQFHVQGTNIYIPLTLQSILNSQLVNE